jgi:hypothetical protein
MSPAKLWTKAVAIETIPKERTRMASQMEPTDFRIKFDGISTAICEDP